MIYKPLSKNFKSKKSAFNTCLVITCVSLTINIWVFCLFKIDKSRCDVDSDLSDIYLKISVAYITFIIFIPIIIIFISNSLIISKFHSDYSRSLNESDISSALNRSASIFPRNRQTKKISFTLVLVSLSYAVLHIPYLIAWYLFYILNIL